MPMDVLYTTLIVAEPCVLSRFVGLYTCSRGLLALFVLNGKASARASDCGTDNRR